MVFEPTFDEIGNRSAELATGGDPDANLPVTEQDVPADADVATEEDDTDTLAEAEADVSLAHGDVAADDLPPYGNA